MDYIRVPVSNHVITQRLFDPNPPPNMAFIPAGTFTMGNCLGPSEGYSEELPLHTNYVSAFYMDTNLITYSVWTNVYLWAMANGYDFDHAGSGKAADHPVQTINWYDMVKWCNARSEKEGLVPAYYTSVDQTNVYRTGRTSVDNSWVKWNAGYRLPTEAEWEKAARGGAAGHRFPWSGADTINWSRANYYSDGYDYDVNPTHGYDTNFMAGGSPYTGPIGCFAPNGYGLYDMAGNVYEWCWDTYSSTYYSSSPGAAPIGPVSSQIRVLRGGEWSAIADGCRCAARAYNGAIIAVPDFGFRCVRRF
jgi:formylglycine-generating enzyme required for sulfatase activity